MDKYLKLNINYLIFMCMNEKILTIINKINNGELSELIPLFGTADDVFEFLKSKGAIYLLDPFSDDIENEELQNLVIYHQLNDDRCRDKTLKEVISRLIDIEVVGDRYWLKISELTDLSSLFKENSRGDISSRNVADSVLGEDYWEPYYNTTDDVYRDVVEDLNKENTAILKQYILEKIGNTPIELNSSSQLMDKISDEQGNDGFITINNHNIDNIVGDSSTMEWLFENELSDLESNLRSLHNNAYNNAYSSDVYRRVWDELETYVDPNKITWVEKKNGKGHVPRLDVTDKINQVIGDFYYEYHEYGDGLNEIPYYLGFIEKLMDDSVYDYLDFRIPDYPDHRLVIEDINESFGDYLE